MEGRLVRVDRNGSKHYEGYITCDRCGGSGIFAYAVINGVIVPTIVDDGVCHKCNGAGKVYGKWIERTAEYQAKLDAKREAKWAAEEARIKAEREAREAKERAEREAREAEIKAQKAISKHFGQIGERISINAIYIRTGSWEQRMFGSNFATTTMYCHTFKDFEGNVFTWKTQNNICLECDTNVTLVGTIKEHSEYKDEKQTVLTRCKIK